MGSPDQDIYLKAGMNFIKPLSYTISKSSIYVSIFQSGYLFHYAFAMLGGLVIILTWFLYY